MRRLDLSNYTVTVQAPTEAKPDAKKTIPFRVRESIITVMFGQGVEGRKLMKLDEVAKKIEESKEDSILLEDADFKLIEDAFTAWPKFVRNEVELVKRIDNAERVNLRDLKEAIPITARRKARG